MDRLGPITTKAAVERTEGPSIDELKATVGWAVSVENAALASVYFRDRQTDELTDNYQIRGNSHHLSSLTDHRIDRARKVFSTYGLSAHRLEPRRYDGVPSLDVPVSRNTPADHVSLAMEILEDIYNTDPTTVERIDRSTHEVGREDEPETVAICHECATRRRVQFMVKAYEDAYYRASEDESAVSRKDEFDFSFSTDGRWLCATCRASERIERV